MTGDEAVLDRPATSQPADEGSVGGRPARRAPARRAPWRWLPAWASFAALAILVAVATLLLMDWLLFDTPAVTARLRVGDQGLPREKLLLAARYRDARVLYLGDSRILGGVDPDFVSETCRCGPGFNGAFGAADLRLTRILAGELLQTLSPEVVVIGVSQWALSDAAVLELAQPAIELVPPWQLAEFGVTLDPAGQLEATLDRAWRLYRYRAEVRATLEGRSGAGDHERNRGYYVNDRPRRLGQQGLDEREQRWFTNFSVEGRRADALRGLLADLRARGIRVVLMAPPLHQALHARVHSQVGAFRAAMEQMAVEGGATFEDFTAPEPLRLTAGQFQDFVHVNEGGAERFSRRLGEALRRHLAQPVP